jgi:plasmid replication initiation protein
MAYNTPAQVRESYFSCSPYCDNKPEHQPYDSLLQWPRNGYFDRLRPDAILLQEAIAFDCGPQAATVAEQVFGSQARQQRISLKHLANILYERALLHRGHLKDIDHRLMEFQERLSIVKMHFPVDGGKTQQNLEKILLDLETQRHDEELGFWKDSTEVRQQLFENAATYSATRHRKDLLCGVEGEYGG